MKKIPAHIYRAFLFFISTLAVLWAGLWAVSKYYEPVLKEEIGSAVLKATKGLYQIHFKSVGTNLILGNATLHDVVLSPNWQVYDSLSKAQKAPDNVYELSLDQLQIKGFNPYQILKNKVLNIRKIKFISPHITMYHKPWAYNAKLNLKPLSNPYESIKAYVNAVAIESVVFQKTQFKYFDRDSAQKNTVIKDMEVQLLDWKLNAQADQDSTRFYYFKDVIFTVPKYTFEFQKGLYHGEWKNVSLLFREKKITVGKFMVKPTVEIDAFQKRLGYRKISVHTELENIQMEGVDMLAFLRKGLLLVQKLNINSGVLDLKNGKYIIDSTTVKNNVIPNQLIQKIPMPFAIDTLNISGIDVSYQEYNKKSGKTGNIYFNGSRFSIHHASNIPAFFQKHKWMQIQVQTSLMNKAPMNIQLVMNYLAPNGGFKISGSVGAINGRVFNQIAVPLGLITIKSLDVNHLMFDLSGDNHQVQGYMKFAYKNLGISIMRKDEESGQLLRKGMLSILANNWVLNDQNPDKKGHFITAPIYFERPNNYVFSKFIWKALLGGIKYSVGITPEKQLQIQKKMNEFKSFKNALQEYKEAREHRKEMREIRKKRNQILQP